MNLQESISFLRKSPEYNFLEIYRDDLQIYIPSNENNKVFLHMIPNENLEAFLKTYVTNNSQDVIVMILHKRLAGASVRTVGAPYHVKIKGINANALQAAVPAPIHNAEVMTQEKSNQPAFLGQNFGLGFAEVVGMSVKAERLEDVRQQLAETKQELQTAREDAKEERRRLERKIEALEDEARDLRSQIAVKEREKDIALMEERASKKSFLDTEGGQKIIDSVSNLGQAFFSAQMGGGGAPALGNPALSESHQNMMNILPSLTEDQVNYLGSVLAFFSNDLFMNQLNQLIHSHHGTVGN